MTGSFVGLALWQQEEGGGSLLERLWHYLNYSWQIAEFKFSIASIVVGLLILVFALAISRVLRMFLERRMQAQRRLDAGVRYSVVRLVTYTIIAAGALLALRTSFHIDLTSLAVLFTALSVGIGFGLQFIAGDIAAGFILLFERPVKIGDYVTFSGPDSRVTEGRVHSINLRTTVVMTNDNIAAVVPNSELTNRKVLNWSYRERRSRISIPVGVAYDSDVDLVTQTLLRAAEGVSYVLPEPKPTVQFLEFGESDLKFRLLVWTDRPRRHPQIKSEVNYRIRRLFLEAGIEIPFPQRDLNLRGGALRLEGGAEGSGAEDEEALHGLSRR